MTPASRTRSRAWKHAEVRAARALGGRRHVRESAFESAPDVVDVPGWVPEVKHRRRLPVLVTGALAQATAYAILGQRPLAVLFERGSRRGIACLWLEDLADLLRRLQAAAGDAPVPSPSPSPSAAPGGPQAAGERNS